MERRRIRVEDGNRFIFDYELLKRGYHDLVMSEFDLYAGAWLNLKRLHVVEFARREAHGIQFASSDEFIAWSTGVGRFDSLVDRDQNWVVPIERTELEVYISYVRKDAIE